MSTVVRCNNVVKTYIQGEIKVNALSAINLDVAKGDFLCLSGPSGSGKSTLLNVIGGLDTPTSGEILIDGEHIEDMKKGQLADLRLHKIGFVFQSYNLIPVLSAQENVELVMQMQGVLKKEREKKALLILEEVGLPGLEKRRPALLSGGQQQRVAVARAIVSRPSLVLADEPTANLDSVTAGKLLDLMLEMNSEHNVTFIISTHDPMVMKMSKRLIKLQDGKIISNKTSQY